MKDDVSEKDAAEMSEVGNGKCREQKGEASAEKHRMKEKKKSEGLRLRRGKDERAG